MNNAVKIMALGGLDEDGKNLYCIELNGKIFVVNCGVKHPEDNMFGVAVVVPDFTYLVENAERVKGIIITHLSDDMMDAVPYLLKKVNAPVYAPALCCWVLNGVFQQHGITNARLNMLPRNGVTEIEGVKFRSFGLTHSTPDAIGISISTPDGNIVVAEKFVVDFNVSDKAFKGDIDALAEIGNEGVLCALVESSYADVPGFTAPRHRITENVRQVFEDAEGRIIVSVYRQNYLRIREILNLAQETNRKVFIFDENLKKVLNICASLGYYSIPKGMEITRDNFDNNMEDVVIIVSGIDQRAFAKIRKIAVGEDDQVEFRESDTVLIASPVVGSNVSVSSVMEDELYRCNVHIFKLNAKQVLAMHPAMEDIKMMLYMLKPKFVIPVMGDYRDFIACANIASASGVADENIVLLDNGQVAEFKNGKLISTADFVPVGESMIDSEHKKAVTSAVLKDRESLSTDGVIVVGIAVNFRTKEIIGGPDIQSRGVIYVKDSEYIIKNIGKIVTNVIEEKVENGSYDNMQARIDMRERINKYVLRETGKKPMVLPAIIEIDLPN